jgi:hypothetical protein
MVTALEEDGRHYLVLEYVSGGALEGVLERQGRLPSKRVWGWSGICLSAGKMSA